MSQAGEHGTVVNSGYDINGLVMMRCEICKSTTRGTDEEKALQKMSLDRCVPNCKNCNNLRRSCTSSPAVPEGGNCNDTYHTCPCCGKKWWQFNRRLHLLGQS